MRPTHSSSLEQWLQYIEAIHPTEIDLGLDRLNQVLARLIPSSVTAFVFTVAGTNGKGTTTAALSSLCQQAGKRVGWYSSPHLFEFNERVRINNQPVPDAALVTAFYAVEQARQDVSLSYFEYTTLAAFYCFKQANLDAWVLEIGLGGRLDAVNTITPDVSVITNIGLDHQGFLGDDIEQIGREKAGICRTNKPTVLGSADLPASVFEVLKAQGAIAFKANERHGVNETSVYWQNGELDSQGIQIPLANAAAALQAFALSPFEISNAHAEQALKNIQLKGRMQRFEYQGRPVTVDVGHNPHAARYIASQLAGQRVHLLLGMLADKDSAEFVAELQTVAATVNVIGLDVPRGLSASELAERLSSFAAQSFANIEACVHYLDEHHPAEPLFIGGSFYTVCEAIRFLER